MANTGINCTNTKINLYLKGDNRVSCVHYSAKKGGGNEITFSNGEEDDSNEGSITVVAYEYGGNFWSSAIGAADSPADVADPADGIVIKSGVIYAGTTSKDDCTAIGGGGNNYGGVTITGGTVTAVAASTGTAIGGGIGWGNRGGDADVTISGGRVYAYNLGIGSDSGNYQRYVPAVAIGGGSADTNTGNLKTTVTIKGGTVYAQSMGGAAIGGGSGTKEGGPATIDISGGTVIAKSTEGTYQGTHISAGVSIGGGTGYTAGGSVELTISGEKTVVRTGSIGGGKTTKGNIGSATVKITGGDISGQVIMAGGATKSCTFDMSGGTMHGSNVVDGNTVNVDENDRITDPNQDAKIQYVENNGGAVWIEDEKGRATITGGTIEGCTAELGGAIYMKGGTFTLSGTGTIQGNTAKGTAAAGTGLGGAVYIEKGEANVIGGSVAGNKASINGGGVYVTGGDVNVSGTASITGNSAGENGGGVYLANGEGDFKLDGESASINNNSAANGGGVYLYKNPLLYRGTIEANKAIGGADGTGNGGGMYIKECLVELDPTGAVSIADNTAKNGAGIFIFGESMGGESKTVTYEVDAVSQPSIPVNAHGLLVRSKEGGTVSFTDNIATVSGGAVCVEGGRFQQESENITITGNKAVNGGGVAVLHGNFTMTTGSIGRDGGANDATSGGGVYVSAGEIWFKGGSIAYNTAINGGGAYVTGGTDASISGKFVMLGGSLSNNTAEASGGGGYVAGNFDMVGGSIVDNSAAYGGGIHVNNGNVTVVDGEIMSNSAKNDGGGFHVYTAGADVKVLMLSGSLIGNKAGANGGGMAVENAENSNTPIEVKIGCLLNHMDKDNKLAYPVEYTGDYEEYADYCGVKKQHASCPVVRKNQAGEIGGGFYMNSDKSTLSFYCVDEGENTAKDKDTTAGMDVVGGTVVIGDEAYHNYEYDSGDEGKHFTKPRGYITMDDATLVDGGKVDIYGDMTNPIFRDEVTVDIRNKENDHFIDHRRSHEEETRYKVHYIENFFGTGLFQALQYDDSDKEITIPAALYRHPGYEIVGWYTDSEYPSKNTTREHKFYKVGEKYDLSEEKKEGYMKEHAADCDKCGTDKSDENLLELYAIWEVNYYTIVFDPNVPAGETYSGEMEDQKLNYKAENDEGDKLLPNEYKYPGHFFKCWEMTKDDGTVVQYENEAEVRNLTEKSGVQIKLYAQWDPCDHKDSHRWSYEAESSKEGGPEDTIVRNCSCGGQTLRATLIAADTVYDGDPHPATLECSATDREAWGEDLPKITYAAEWLDDGLNHEGQKLELSKEENKPFHAGVYTASITKPDGADAKNPVTASVEYTIAKADQDPPATKPTYTVADGSSEVVIDEVEGNVLTDKAGKTHTAVAEYRLSYYSDDELKSEDWKQITDGTDKISLTMGIAWTSYFVEARYEELNDYNASKFVRADAVYHFTGDVIVKIICDEGIEPFFEAKLGADKKLDGATLTLTTKDGYYLIGGDYEIAATLEKKDSQGLEAYTLEEETDTGTSKKYSIKDVPTNSTLTITIGTSRKKPVVKAQVVSKQVFRPITGTNTTISRDSAFTAAFRVDNYDPRYDKDGETYGVYSDLSLKFSPGIPADTTVILLDRSDDSYWYYRGGGTEVPLTAFTKMGESGTSYGIPEPAEDNGYVDLRYQFIVDFSQSSAGCSGDSLTMTLEASIADSTKAPPLSADDSAVTVNMESSTFEFTTSGASGLTCSFNCAFNRGADASKWDGRASALVLTPAAGSNLPPDARIKAVVDGATTDLYRVGDSFIVPLSMLGTKTVAITLHSALFPMTETDYSFDAKWLISPSKAGNAPISGYQAGNTLSVTFTSPERKIPSLKLTGSERMLTVGQTLNLGVEQRNLEEEVYTPSATLQRKMDDGSYISTGSRPEVPKTDTGSMSVSLGGQGAGSFRVKVTVKRSDGITVMEVPYYFVIKPTP